MSATQNPEAETEAEKAAADLKVKRQADKLDAIEHLKWLDKITAPVKMERSDQNLTITALKSLESFVLRYPEQ